MLDTLDSHIALFEDALRTLEKRFPAQSNLSIPNAAVKDGTAGAKLKRILDALKTEAVYFTALNGFRTAVIIVDMPDASKMPALAEPFFLTFSADVEFYPVMTAADLAKGGLDALGQLWG